MSVAEILPPSPPSTSHRHRESVGPSPTDIANTPTDSPASFPPSSGTGTRKRVEFSPWTNVLQSSTTEPSSDPNSLRLLPRSRDCQSLAKSILKPSIDLTPTDEHPQHDFISPASTMEHLVEQLAQNDKTSSVDAYQALSQIIKAYEELPGDGNIRSHVSRILKYIRRDLAVQEQTASTPMDINIVTQALKVSVIFVWSEHLSPLVAEDFKVFITDRAIHAIAEHTLPKVIIVHYMHLLAVQNFRTQIFTSGTRTTRLLDAMRELTNHMQGKGVVSERLLVYQKLIEQARPIMKTRANLWVKEVITSLMSTVKDIRDKAVSVSTRACAAFPACPAVALAAREALAETVKDRTGSQLLTARLDKMIAAKDQASQVPQIWAVVMLLCNSGDSRFDQWDQMKDWLKLIQRCFNCSDASVRSQALPAWNRFIYINKPHEASDHMASLLAKPIVAQIDRSSGTNSGKGLRPAAASSYCMLLYYGFRPAATHKQYTRMWNEYIVKVTTSQFLGKSTANADLCCRVLATLFWKENTTTKIWNENRAHESRLMEPEELPTLDLKWTRSKCDAILKVFTLLFSHSTWGATGQYSDQALVAKAWRSFVKAIHESTSKEIKPSAETKKALDEIVQFLSDDLDLANDTDDAAHVSRMRIARNIAINELGAAAMTESLITTTATYSTELLSDVLKIATAPLKGKSIESVVPNRSRGQVVDAENMPVVVRNGLKAMSEQMVHAYRQGKDALDRLLRLAEICARTMTRIPSSFTVQCMKLLEDGLALFMKDSAKIYQQLKGDSRGLDAWRALSAVTIGKLAEVPIKRFSDLDHLLAASLSSSNSFTANYLLSAWNRTDWQDQEAFYGSELMAAIAKVQQYAEVSLPGVPTVPRQYQPLFGSQLLLTEEICNNLDNVVAPSTSVRKSREPQLIHDMSTDVRDSHVPPQSAAKRRSSSKGATKAKLRHDDSQIAFVAVQSSPTNMEEVESQDLTERQKEVRERQRVEPAVTFADLRSSPSARSVKSSRAASVDCEMARKVAASESLPATPTITKHGETADDQEMPSPTPRARHKKLMAIGAEVPSSPPSVLGQDDTDVPMEDGPLTPSKTTNEMDVYLSDTQEIDVEDMATTGHQDGSDMYTAAAIQTAGDTIEVSHSRQPPVPNHADSEMGDSPTGEGDFYQTEREDSDDLDNAIASQLSQDLDRAISIERVSATQRSGSTSKAGRGKRKRERGNKVDKPVKRRSTRSQASSTETGIFSHEGGNRAARAGSVTMEQSEPRPEEQARLDVHSEEKKCDNENREVDEIMGRPMEAGQPSHKSMSPHKSRVETSEADEGLTDLAENAHERGPSFRGEASPARAGDDGSPRIDVTKVLEQALAGLEQGNGGSLDLRAIDELCFQIRFKAQEIVQRQGSA